jgi:hypothetical protein
MELCNQDVHEGNNERCYQTLIYKTFFRVHNFGILMGNLRFWRFGEILPLAYHHPNTKLPPNATLVAKKDLMLSNIVGINWWKKTFL